MAKRTAPDPADALSDARSEALSFLNKKVPGAFRQPEDLGALTGISTGSVAVDYITGGIGFPRSKISEVFGAPSSGKSTLMATACAKAQALGLYPVYIDVERGLDRIYCERIGFDVGAALTGERGLYVRPDSFEEALLIVETMITKGRADLVIVDSVEGLVPEQFLKGSIADLGQMGVQARIFAQALPRLVPMIDRPDHKAAVVFVNQLRANIETGWKPPGSNTPQTKAGGGWALHHFSSLRLELKQTKKDAKFVERPSLVGAKDPEKIATASRHSAMTFKNKVSGSGDLSKGSPYRRIEFYIRFDPDKDLWGIDNLQTLLDIAETQGLIDTKGGGYFLYNGLEDMKVQGEDALYEWFSARPAVLAELRSRLTL